MTKGRIIVLNGVTSSGMAVHSCHVGGELKA